MADKQIELGPLLFDGKAKQIFAAPNKELVVVQYKDDVSAFSGEKKGKIDDKGIYNNKICASLFKMLESSGIPSHFVTRINDRQQLCRKLNVIPLIIAVRNVVSGSLAERTGQAEGTDLPKPVIELWLAGQAHGTPPATKEQVAAKGIATAEEVDTMSKIALQVNEVLRPFMQSKKLRLVDCGLAFGRTDDNQIDLADEISADTCRFWDSETGEKFGLERFRLDLDGIKESYAEVWKRLDDS